jgi:hypothetical protein
MPEEPCRTTRWSQLAADLSYALQIGGPSDEELEQLNREDKHGDDAVPFQVSNVACLA